ncbi:MAG TPA: hypothetical protein QGF02_00420 [Candidatus Babeliales bacterium]|nr:hypothetical protein [Candidatus Babeliales bacterium]
MKKIVSIVLISCSLVNIIICDENNNATHAGVLTGLIPFGLAMRSAANQLLEKPVTESNVQDVVDLKEHAPRILAVHDVTVSLCTLPYIGAAIALYRKKRKKLAFAVGVLGAADIATRIIARDRFAEALMNKRVKLKK